MATSSVAEVALELAPWQQLQRLLDASYPRPPRDVFERVASASHATGVLGLVMLGPHCMGGHLANLAVAPSASTKSWCKPCSKLLGKKVLQW